MLSGLVRKSPLLAGLVLFACKDSSGPPAVATTVAVSDVAATATAGSVVAPGLTFTVKDQNGNPLAGVPITVTVTGGGTVATPPTTSTAGPTSIGTWTLGTIVGVNTVTIKAGNLTPITFSITTVAGPATQIIAASGGNQSVPAGSILTGLQIKVADQFGNGVAGKPVTISVSAGGGTVTPTSGTTDASGLVIGINWTLSKLAIPQSLSVVSGTITGSVVATIATSYNLEVRYFGGDPTPEVKAAFANAAARIRGAVTGTLGVVQLTNVPLGDPAQPNTNCGVAGVTLNEGVRDLLIFAQIHPIDGPGKILGAAGPCLVRSISRLTIIGVMEFDSEDLTALANSGRLESVILHEMTHVVGFGTLWEEKKPPLVTGVGSADPRFTGTNAIAACASAGGTTLCSGGVAVENCVGLNNCGAGTQDSHWREGNSTIPGFRTELMTGFIERTGTFMPYSNMTIQSLADEGYTVNPLAADPYTVPNPSLRALLQLDGPVDVTKWESVRHPLATVSAAGAIRSMVSQ